MALRGIRGAITVDENTEAEILDSTKTLLNLMIEENDLQIDDIATIFFSVTKDLDQTFPAKAGREMGLEYTPFLCLTEIDVPNAIERVLRILVLVNTKKTQKEMRPIYLKGASALRPENAYPLPETIQNG